MNRLEEIQDRQTAIRTELLDIEQITEPTEADATRQDELLTEWDSVEAERTPLAERAERIAAVRNAAADSANVERSERPAPEVMTHSDPFEDVEALRFSTSGPYAPSISDDASAGVVSRAVTALSDVRYRPRGVSDDAVQRAVRAVETIPGVARHALLHGSPAYRSAFTSWLASQGENVVWTAEEGAAVRAAMSLTGANGGYTLPTLLDPTLIKTGTASKNPMRQISRVVSGTQNVWHGVSAGNVAVYWTAEAAAMTEGSMTLGSPSVTAAKLTAYVVGSYEIFEDSDLQGQLPGLIDEAFTFAESDAFVVGSGSNAPKGILTAISGTAGDIVTASTRGAIGGVDLFALSGAVPSRYEDNAVWLANKALYNSVAQLGSASNGALFWTNLNQSTPPALLGAPIYKSSAMSAAQTSGTFVAILGDFSQFLIYDRIGTQVEFVQNIFNSSALPTGQRALIAHKRVGSDVLDVNAFRLLKA